MPERDVGTVVAYSLSRGWTVPMLHPLPEEYKTNCGDRTDGQRGIHVQPLLLHVCKNLLPPTLLFLGQNPLFSRRFQHFLTLGDKYTCRIVHARKAIASYARQPLLLRKQPH